MTGFDKLPTAKIFGESIIITQGFGGRKGKKCKDGKGLKTSLWCLAVESELHHEGY